MQEKKLIFSIILTLCLLFAIQVVIVLIVSTWYNIDFHIWDWYMPITIMLHITASTLLCLLTKAFRTIPQGEKLTRVNFINTISLFRISSTPTLVLFIITPHANQISIITIIWTAVIFLSDFFDGKLARQLKKMTQIGQYIDSWSDYLILIVISVLLYNHAFIPVWFFISAVMRIVVPIFGVLILYIINCNTYYHTSWFARASIFAIMTVFGFSLTRTLFENIQLHKQIVTALGTIASIGFIVPAIATWLVSLVQHARK